MERSQHPLKNHSQCFFIVAGEKSASLYGTKLIQDIVQHIPDARIYGCGGKDMCQEGLIEIVPFDAFQVMGISAVLRKLPHLVRHFFTLRDAILHHNPQCVILVDQPSFSLRLAKSLRNKGFQGKIVQYVAPTVWAYKQERIHTLEKYFDALLSIYPFEKKYFTKSSLPCFFVGHPLAMIAKHTNTDLSFLARYGMQDKQITAIFPGSRVAEITRNLPLQLQAVSTSSTEIIAISMADNRQRSLYEKILRQCMPSQKNIVLIPEDERYVLMKHATSALATSGTVTIELALYAVPTIVTYSLSLLNYLIAKYVYRLQLPYYCMVNILLEKEIFPECIGYGITARDIKNKLETHVFPHTTLQQLATMLSDTDTQAIDVILKISS